MWLMYIIDSEIRHYTMHKLQSERDTLLCLYQSIIYILCEIYIAMYGMILENTIRTYTIYYFTNKCIFFLVRTIRKTAHAYNIRRKRDKTISRPF